MNEEIIPIHPIKAMIDAVNRKENEKRAKTQMTLGKMITVLEAIEPARPIVGLGEADSYRGYYSDLAFEPSGETTTAGKLLVQCRAAMGRTFEGYKGGDFVMHENTPRWISEYGTASGIKIMDLNLETDPITMLTEQEE